MSIDRETNAVPAYVSFHGRVAPFEVSNVWASNMPVSNLLAANVAAPDMLLSAASRDSDLSCWSDRDLYPPSSPPDTR